MNQIDLVGRHAVVTGGGQGIGLAVALRLLKSGATVSLWDHDSSLLRKTLDAIGATVSGEVVDVTDARAIQEAVNATVSKHGAIDILVCSAGVTGPNAKLWDYPVDAWTRVMRVNVDGVFNCCRAVVPGMIERGYGRIVNIASVAGKEGNPNASAYSASKAAVIGLTKSLGKELAHADIAVNCVTPAAAKTRIFDQMTKEHIEFMLSKIPRGRFVEVDEIASMIAWLSSAENSFTTGAVFDLSGGRATY
jgi:NAD(P)-dependent dehydrogenase (short-subunit alcohol dehydrogenase family)